MSVHRSLAGALAALQRPPSRLEAHLLLAGAMVIVLAIGFLLVALAWRRRFAAVPQAEQFGLPPRPAELGPPLVAPMDGVYVGTVGEGGWQDRIGRLGVRLAGPLTVTADGVDLAGLWLPVETLRGARVGEGLANRVVPGTGLLIVEWSARSRAFESGFRGVASRYEEVLTTISRLVAGHSSQQGSPA